MIVAGESSGDKHAAKLVSALRTAEPDTEFSFFGAAGPSLREAGVEAIVEADGLAIVGLAEIGRALPMFLRASRALKKAAVERKPDVVVLVDFPDFNLKLAKALRKKGFRIIYYISPQMWAWREYRASTIRNHVDLLLTILPFEKEWYAAKGIDHVEYVGNPLAREVHADRTRVQFCVDNSFDPSKPIISLLPGSRHKEITRILPVMLQASAAAAQALLNVQFVIPAASSKARIDIEKCVTDLGESDLAIRVIEGQTYDALAASDAAAVTSGTATLEAGIIGTPMVVVYKTSGINYSLLEPLISVEHYGLINLIAGERVAKELIQREFTAEALAAELLRLIEPKVNAALRENLRKTAEKLGHGGASIRAAEAVLRMIDTVRPT
jgi:lipid-A-disaccharide synthase